MFNYERTTGRIARPIRAAWNYLMYSSMYLSIAAGAMAYVSCCIQGITFLPVTAGIMFLVTYSVYNLNRKTDEKEDAINHSERFRFTKKFERPLFYSAVCAYGFALLLSSFYGVATMVVTLILLISGIAYSVPLLPAGSRYRRLKEIPAVKNLIVSTAWALPPALLPVFVSGINAGPLTGITGLFFFTLVFVNSTLFDMRDIEGDAIVGVQTIPVLLGVEKTKILLTLMNLVLGTYIIVFSMKTLSLIETIVLIIGIIYAQGYIISFHQMAMKNALCDFIADGQFIVCGGLLYLSTYIIP